MARCVPSSMPRVRKRASCRRSLVEDPERRVARAGELGGSLEHALQQRVDVELRRQAAPHLDQAPEALLTEGAHDAHPFTRYRPAVRSCHDVAVPRSVVRHAPRRRAPDGASSARIDHEPDPDLDPVSP